MHFVAVGQILSLLVLFVVQRFTRIFHASWGWSSLSRRDFYRFKPRSIVPHPEMYGVWRTFMSFVILRRLALLLCISLVLVVSAACSGATSESAENAENGGDEAAVLRIGW